ncbi:hypothetical protein NUACC21_41410 [Scytonema sp. NUACC21]
MDKSLVRVLLIDNSEDDYIMTRNLLADVEVTRFDLEWVSTYETALEAIARQEHDIYLIDYHICTHNDLDLLREALQSNCEIPVIILTSSSSNHGPGSEIMELGAVDCLSKREINVQILERSLGYAIRQRQLYQQVKLQVKTYLEEQVQQQTYYLQHALDFESTLKCITHKVRSSLDENHILQTVVRELATTLKAECCHVGLHHTDYTASTIYHEYPLVPNSVQDCVYAIADACAPHLDSHLLQGHLCQFCFTTKHSVSTNQTKAVILVCPILDDQGILGNLWLLKPQQQTFEEMEVELVQQVAIQCAIALRQSRLHQGTQAKVRELERLNQLNDARFQAFMNHSPTVSFIKDENGRYVYVNELMERIFKLKQSDLQGKTDYDWLPEETAKQVDENDRIVLATDKPIETIEIIPTPDNCLHYWLTFKFPMTDLSGQRFVGGVAVDITERKRAETSLQKLNHELEMLVQAKTAKLQQAVEQLTIEINERKQVEQALRQAKEELEIRVAERTHELVQANDYLQRELFERRRAERALFEEKELAQVTLQSIGDAVITTNALGKIQHLNRVAETLTGWSHSEAKGLPITEVFQIVHEQTRQPVENPVEIALREGRIAKLPQHTVLIGRDGNELPIDDSAAPICMKDGRVIGAVMVFHDISHIRSLTRQLSWQATHDALTGLVNRREFDNCLEQALISAKAQHQTHVLCYLDLDNFKIVNDTCGHTAGDELLRQATTLFQSQIRKTDTLARLGGDEFGILLNQCSLDRAVQIANAVREQIREFRFVWQDKPFTLGVSIGLAVIDKDTKNIATVLSAADATCYAAKNNGRNRVHIYQSDDIDLVRQHGEMQWVGQITQALEENRLCLYYQSIVPTASPQVKGEHYEVLVRLQDKAGHLILPMAFIPAAERYNLMHLIDRWVIQTLFATQAEHYREIWSCCQSSKCECNYLYAINLSGASINDEQFIEFLYEQFALHQIPPSLICFEITETVAIANLSKAAQFIRELRNLGCRFALDDFGNGMSSFAYLKHLPVDYLKIDGEFIKDIVDDPIDSVMVEAIHQIGQVMGIQTIAEFVENDAILQKVKTLGVNYAQGYGIAEPRPFSLNHSFTIH